jgi:hypothetical protein
VSAAQTMEELAERADAEVRAFSMRPLLDTARGLLNETKVHEKRDQLAKAIAAVKDAPDVVKNARERLLEQQDRLKVANEAWEQALVEAEWALDARIMREGNKTYIVTQYRNREDVPEGVEAEVMCIGNNDALVARRQVTADEAKDWKRRTAATHLNPQHQAVTSAEHAVALAKIDVDHAEDLWHAARYRLDAARTDAELAVASVACLARSLTTDREGTR